MGNADRGQDRVIEQFMWRFQELFRISAGSAVKLALEEIGFVGDPKVILVGFQVAGQHTFPICIEPEAGPYTPADLANVAARGAELYEHHPERQGFHTDPDVDESYHRSLRNQMRADAISEALSASAPGRSRTFFVGLSPQVDDYEVHVVVSIDSEAFAKIPRLQTTEWNRFSITPSIVDAVIKDVLRRASRSLCMPNPGGSFDVLGADASEIARSAATAFVRCLLYLIGCISGDNATSLFNTISALPYEGRSGSGRLILAKRSHPAIHELMKFRHPVDIDDTHAVRKLLEVSGGFGDLLSDGEQLYGIGRLTSMYDPSSESVFVVNVAARGAWELSHAGQPLLSVRDGVPQLPKRPLNVDYFHNILERLLPDADESALVSLAEEAGYNTHGAMLIISSDAVGEAKRLEPQAWSVEPVLLAPEILSQLISMDGGVLVDAKGYCHAIGVILDGLACGSEDPARGSRFNNAVRYLDSRPPPTVVVVYSADGNIDILPQLRPRVSRKTVERAVDTYVALALSRPLGSGLSDAREAVSELRFYLSQEQCDRVNAAKAAVDRWNDETPDPKMDETYWLPEGD